MRQFVVKNAPDAHGRSVLEASEYRYLVQVLRNAVGDVIEVRLPDGRLCSMQITEINRKEKQVSLLLSKSDSSIFSESQSMPPLAIIPEGFTPIVLFQWMLKGPKMDQVIRQATETGVSLIIPVTGDRCLSKDADVIGSEKTSRWERIVREARQQSGSPVATQILAPVSVSAIAGLWASLAAEKKAIGLVLTEAPLARKSLHEYLVSGAELTALAIGPEGGMTTCELDLLAEAGFVCIHFRTNILRAETAALYGIAAVQSALTESVKWQLKE